MLIRKIKYYPSKNIIIYIYSYAVRWDMGMIFFIKGQRTALCRKRRPKQKMVLPIIYVGPVNMTDGFVAQREIGKWISFYNHIRPHSSLDGQTPHEVYSKAQGMGNSPSAVKQNRQHK
ncbi:MAG: hypothetical protein COA81_06865 [Alphaproteobacteria bacterium]|nr:MAG: hypothetical protein COA81_06865 [Alphaproteobacteria bacterium]